MTDGTAGRMPAMKTVWIEQLRVVGLAIRREGTLAALVLVLGSLAVIAFSRLPALQAMVDGEVGQLVFDPGEPPWGFFAVLAALLLPFVVWKGERRFGDTPLWSLPVDHRRHALLKVAAGWVGERDPHESRALDRQEPESWQAAELWVSTKFACWSSTRRELPRARPAPRNQ